MVKKFTKKALENYKKIIVSELKRKLNKPGSDLEKSIVGRKINNCLLYTSPSPRDRTRSRMPSSA